MADLKGICVPICTPFDKSGDASTRARLRAHVDSMLEAGVHIILSCGGTGEFAYLTRSGAPAHSRDRRQAGRAAAPRFIVQASAISTRDTIENAKAAEDLGADAIMVLPPYFEGPTHGRRDVALRAGRQEPSKTPIVVYNIPQNTNRDITPDDASRACCRSTTSSTSRTAPAT